jgi:hypothetical protein
MKKFSLKSKELNALLVNADVERLARNFASRKTNTKKFAKEHQLFLKDGQTSAFENELFEEPIEASRVNKRVVFSGPNVEFRIDWEEAIKQRYNGQCSLEQWLDHTWKSKTVKSRNLSAMSKEDESTYNCWFSHKSKLKKELGTEENYNAFIQHVSDYPLLKSMVKKQEELTEDDCQIFPPISVEHVFFSKKFITAWKAENIEQGREKNASCFKVRNWM